MLSYMLSSLVVLFCSLPLTILASRPDRLTSLPSSRINPRASDCNGNSALCDKSYGAVTYVGAHNSYAIGTNNLFANQDQDVTQQLKDGIRLLQLQAHNQTGTIQLCHSSCTFYNGGTLEDYLKKVKSWLDSNPNNVVTLLIVNIDNLAASMYDTVFKSSGLDSQSYVPSSSPLPATSWPTLGSMIDSKTNLVTFLDNGADSSVPYLIDEFSNMWETAYDVVDSAYLGSDCSVNRTQGDSASQLYLINHFLDRLVFGQAAPNVDAANVTNSASGDASLGSQVDACKTANSGRAPNFLLLDYYQYAGTSPFEIAAGLNGVQYDSSTPIASPATATASSSSTATGTPNHASPRLTGDGLFLSAWLLLGAGYLTNSIF